MKKIAIIRRNGLGDLLCAFPLVRYFQICEPGSHITLFVDRRNAPLIPYLPPVEEVVVFPSKGNKYLGAWRTASPFRGRFDLALSAKTSPMKLMNLFLHWLKAKERVAYVDSSWHSRLVNRPLPYDPTVMKVKHQALKALKMAAPQIDEIPQEFFPTLQLPQFEKRLKLPYPVVLASATTTRTTNRFNSIRYSRLLNRLHEENPIGVVIIGEAQDRVRAWQIAARLKTPYVVHFPRNFEEFMLFLEAADMYFVGDGGIAHLGAALGKPAVVLYGETNPIEWRPLSLKAETFYHPTHVDCINDEEIFQGLKRIRTRERDN
ncbi:MAG: glycosyltransferase family 9 protein [Chlamydiales bacterium]|nr:glycosyltransferase family 9 protein [Chlamydiales bacterium]